MAFHLKLLVSASDLSNLQSLLSGLRTAGSGSSSTRAGPSIELSEAITGERVLETALRNQGNYNDVTMSHLVDLGEQQLC